MPIACPATDSRSVPSATAGHAGAGSQAAIASAAIAEANGPREVAGMSLQNRWRIKPFHAFVGTPIP